MFDQNNILLTDRRIYLLLSLFNIKMPSSIVTQYKEEDDLDAEFLRDNDSLYVLPLKFIPLNTSSLRRSRLVKTFSLETAVEVFRVSHQIP